MTGIEAAFFGVLGRDAESKVSKAGKAYLRAGVRVGDGEAAQWLNVTAFDPEAIPVADKFVKGARVYVEGRLSLDQWTAEGGEKRTSLSCLSWHCRLAQIGRNRTKRKTGRERPESQATPAQAAGELDDQIPF